MKFKIGQKVRVKVWEDMPQDMQDRYGTNRYAGQVGVILQYFTEDMGWDVKTENEKYSFFCLEQELEPVIKIGEQLLLWPE